MKKSVDFCRPKKMPK